MRSDDIQIGDVVTVLSWKEREVEAVFSVTLSWEPQPLRKVRSTSYVGEVLDVVAISLPFIAVSRRRIRADARYDTKVVSLDTRECDVVKITPEYAEALTREEQRRNGGPHAD